MEKKTIYIIFTVVELVLAVLLWILHYGSFRAGGKMEFFFVSGVFGGYIFVTIGMLLMVILSEEEEGITMLYFVICGAVVYIVAALFTFMTYTDSDIKNRLFQDGDKLLVKTILAAVQAAIFIIDAVYRIMNR
ncbi:uncharacterized protein LOC111058761 [Nilaparvata lugens]|uniref:uncharacterized protein LOC111058761 n=1 Tax=Nilaparvata lugens TaxID=108931 RepID=UPI000B9952E3|nr:uncharacterized protein LOC111058761 [Nilaparvata lugens]